jgi:hypothetical protein
MIKDKKIKELEQKVFELEARLTIMELQLSSLIVSQNLDLDAEKWY